MTVYAYHWIQQRLHRSLGRIKGGTKKTKHRSCNASHTNIDNLIWGQGPGFEKQLVSLLLRPYETPPQTWYQWERLARENLKTDWFGCVQPQRSSWSFIKGDGHVVQI